MQLKTEWIGSKIFLITLLCVGLALFLYLRPLLFSPEPKPRIIDRLPDSEVIGKVKIINVVGNAYPALFKNKVKFREYLTFDFVLAQAKNYGLDIQKDAYFFSNSKKDWGTIIPVSDSSKIKDGFERLKQFYSLKDTVIFKHNVKKMKEFNLYFYYDKSILLICKGKKIKTYLDKVLHARYGEVETSWKHFSWVKDFKSSSFLIYNRSKEIQNYGFDYALMTQTMDSMNVQFTATLHSPKPLGIKEKEPGICFENNLNYNKSFNIHLDATEFSKNKTHPLYAFLEKKGARVGFPLETFFAAWGGDLSFHEGGKQIIEEEVVELTYDEEFNPVEVKKMQQVPITGFSTIMSVNEKGNQLVNKLFAKGIVNKQGNKYRFLFSPPLTLNILPESLSAYTSARPKITTGSKSQGYWKYKGVTYFFQIDEIKRNKVKASVSFPFMKLTELANL